MTPISAISRRAAAILSTDYLASAEALGAYRIAFALANLVVIGVPLVSWIAEVPAAFFDPPPGLARLMPGFPADWVLHTVDFIVILLYLALLFGIRTQAVSLAISLSLLYGHLFQFSFGKIDHDAIAVLTPALFAWSWGRSLSLDALQQRVRPTEDGLSRGLLASLLAFGFLTAGLPKLVGWIDFDLSRHGVLNWVLDTEISNRGEFLAPFFLRVKNPWIWESLDYAAVAFELGAVVALFVSARAFKVWCVAAVLFHFFNYLALNISFTMYLPLYMAFVDWEPAADRARRLTARLLPTSLARSTAAACIVVSAVLAWSTEASSKRWSLLDVVQKYLPTGGWVTFAVFASAAATAIALLLRALIRSGPFWSDRRTGLGS